MELAQTIINGLLLGGLYAIVGLGMSLIFGIVKLTNLAHGEFVIVAAYLATVVVNVFGLHPLASLILVAPVMFVIGYLVQNLLVTRVLHRGVEPPLLIMFGLSVILQNLLLQIFTADPHYLHSEFGKSNLSFGGIGVSVMNLLNLCIGVLVIALLHCYLKYTYSGRSIRAASDDTTGAQLMGVNVKNTYGIAMGVAMAISAVAGVLVGMSYNFYPTTGSQYLIIAFGVVVIGGIGSIFGTLLAGLIFGLSQLLGSHFFGTGVQMLAGYVAIVIMLAFRPQGLFSR